MSSSSNASVDVAASNALLVREANGGYRAASSDEVLQRAKYLMSHRVRRGVQLQSPEMVRDFLRLQIGALAHEVFAVLYLDAQHRLIAYKELFRGTLTQTSVYPREVIKEALVLNAAAAILAHNHPSGDAKPSAADDKLTENLATALRVVEVTVLDHQIITGDVIFSYAERGLL